MRAQPPPRPRAGQAGLDRGRAHAVGAFGGGKLGRRRRVGLAVGGSEFRQHHLAVERLQVGGEADVEQAAHLAVPLEVGVAAQEHADQAAAVALGRGHQVVAGAAGEAGLDAIGALIARQDAVDGAEGLAAEGEARGREEVIVLRVVLQQRLRQHGHVARGGDLLRIGQAGGVAEHGPRHAELLRPCRSSAAANAASLPPMRSAIVTAASFADCRMIARIVSLTVIFCPAPRPSSVAGCAAACAETVNSSSSFSLPASISSKAR